MTEPSVLMSKDARGVATVTINRPQVRNAIDDNVIRLLTDAFRTLGADAATRIVVLTGSGTVFSAGADLNLMRRMGAASEAENLAGAKAARRYFLTGEPFSAAEACRLGLLHQVVAQS